VAESGLTVINGELNAALHTNIKRFSWCQWCSYFIIVHISTEFSMLRCV